MTVLFNLRLDTDPVKIYTNRKTHFFLANSIDKIGSNQLALPMPDISSMPFAKDIVIGNT